MSHRYSSSSWSSALFAISTRYAMLATQPVEHRPSRLRAAGTHVGQPSLEALDGLHAIEQVLIGLGVLDHNLGSSVDRQDQRIAGFFENESR